MRKNFRGRKLGIFLAFWYMGLYDSVIFLSELLLWYPIQISGNTKSRRIPSHIGFSAPLPLCAIIQAGRTALPQKSRAIQMYPYDYYHVLP